LYKLASSSEVACNPLEVIFGESLPVKFSQDGRIWNSINM
jgi:hypothetical protein